MRHAFLALILSGAFCTILAQNDLQANVNLQFRFDNPGARARAMGGAFIGLADDTTAIFANPAGLTRLSSNTLVGELASTQYDNPIPFFSGRIEQVGLQDFDFQLQEREFEETITTPPFAAYVQGSGKIKWGVFYNELVNYERTFQTEGIAIPPDTANLRPVDVNRIFFFNPSENNVEVTMRGIGGSIAGRLSDSFSVGLTLSYYSFDYQGQTVLQVPDLEAFFPDVNFPDSTIDALRPFIGAPQSIIDVDGSDESFAIYGGAMWRPSDRFSVGLAYKRQPTFTYDYVLTGTQGAEFTPFEAGRGEGDFNTPDSGGLGFSFYPSDTFLLTLEVGRVLYSDLSDDYVRFFNDPNDPVNATQVVEDATEYRAGFEYFITSAQIPIALRAGYWFEPYHALVNELADTQLIFRFLDDRDDFDQGIRSSAFLQRFEEDENHVTAGIGLTFGSFIVDLAADFADTTRTITLSGIYRFSR